MLEATLRPTNSLKSFPPPPLRRWLSYSMRDVLVSLPPAKCDAVGVGVGVGG